MIIIVEGWESGADCLVSGALDKRFDCMLATATTMSERIRQNKPLRRAAHRSAVCETCLERRALYTKLSVKRLRPNSISYVSFKTSKPALRPSFLHF